MTKPKKSKSVRVPLRIAYHVDPAKVAIGSAIGAAFGALTGAAFVRKPTLYNDMMQGLVDMLMNPAALTMLQQIHGMSGEMPQARPVPGGIGMHPPGGCGVEGCPSNNPHAYTEEETRVSQQNPTWTHTQVAVEVAKRLTDQADRAHLAAQPPKRSRVRSRKKKGKVEEPTDTTN